MRHECGFRGRPDVKGCLRPGVWSRVRPATTGILTLTNPVTSSAPAGPSAGAGQGR